MDAIYTFTACLVVAGFVGMVGTSLFMGTNYSERSGNRPFGRIRKSNR